MLASITNPIRKQQGEGEMGAGKSKPVSSEAGAAAPATETGAAAAPAPAPKKGCCGCAPGGEGTTEDLSKYGMMPDNKRKTRDVFCCCLFIIFWLGMLVIGAIGIRLGQWQRLVYGTDYQGKICGVDVPGKKYITYPRTNEDFLANMNKKSPLDYTFYGICTESCPGLLEVVCNYKTPGYDVAVGTPPVFLSTTGEAGDMLRAITDDPSWTAPTGSPSDLRRTLKKNCWTTPQATSSIMFRCIPVYNVTNAEGTRCAYPSWVQSAYDPSCIVAEDSKSGTVQRPAKPNLLFDQLNSARQVWGRWFGDLARSWWVILLCAVGLALVLGFVWILFLKYFTGCMVWTTILSVILLLGCLTGYFYWKAGLVNFTVPASLTDKLNQIPGKEAAQGYVDAAKAQAATYQVPQEWNDSFEQYGLSYKGMAYAFTGVLVIVLCLVVALRGAIRTAIEVIKLGSDALRALPTLIFFPCTNVLAIGLFLVWWVFVAACLQSAGNLTTADVTADMQKGLASLGANYNLTGDALTNATAYFSELAGNSTAFQTIQDIPVMNYLILYHIFGLLWTAQFIQGIATMTVAGAVASWYFSRLPKEAEGDETMQKLKYNPGRTPILSSLLRTVRYYLGSVAFGSLLIAFIQFIRLIFAYIQQKLEKDAKNNANLRFILCCIQCCLKCLQSLVEVVTRNAYVFVALKGDSFCGAGRRVFSLIINHGSVFTVVNVLGEVIMFLGKILIAVASAFGAYVLLDNLAQFKPGGENALSSTWLPILVTLFFGYATASGFMMVFDLSVDTVLVCYVTDIDENLERNGGDSKFKYPIHIDRGAIDVKAKMAAQDAAKGKGKEAPAGTTTPLSSVAPAPSPAAGQPDKGAAPSVV